jgi:hypothetical protein
MIRLVHPRLRRTRPAHRWLHRHGRGWAPGDKSGRLTGIAAAIAALVVLPLPRAPAVGPGAAPSTRSGARRASAAAANPWIDLAAGASHTCCVLGDRTLWCWGNNGADQLGDGTHAARSAPHRVGTGTTWRTVRAGYAHTCATRTTGSLWCWGSNSYGQLGDGTTTTRLTPTRIGTATTWTTLAAA